MAVPRDPSHGSLRIGVLALQGSFREHISTLKSIPGVEAVEVRTKEQLASVSGLIIPGGESTTMANIAERWGLIPCLKDFAKSGRPVWGTCAGLIFLADRATGQCYINVSILFCFTALRSSFQTMQLDQLF